MSPRPLFLPLAVSVAIVLCSGLALLNDPCFDEATEEFPFASFHLLYGAFRLAPVEIATCFNDGWGQALAYVPHCLWLPWLPAYAAIKCTAILWQLVVFWLWWAWAGMVVSPRTRALAAILFALPPDNYFGSVVMSQGHHFESVAILLVIFMLLQRFRQTGGWRALTAIGGLIGLAVSFYLSNLPLAVFIVAGCWWWFPALPRPRRYLVLLGSLLLGYAPYALQVMHYGASPVSQFIAPLATTDQENLFGRYTGIDQPLLARAAENLLRYNGSFLFEKLAVVVRYAYCPVSDRHTYLPTAFDRGYATASVLFLALVLLTAWRYRRRCSAPYAVWYALFLLAAFFAAGERFTVSHAMPGQPGSFRYLTALYPLLFTLLGWWLATFTARWSRLGCRRRVLPVAGVTLVLLFLAVPALLRWRHDSERFGRIFVLRPYFLAPLGFGYYRHFRAAAPDAAWRAIDGLDRIPAAGPRAAELVARGYAFALVAASDFSAAAAMAAEPPEQFAALRRGWWQGLGFSWGAVGHAREVIPATREDARYDEYFARTPPDEPERAEAFWRGAGLFAGQEPLAVAEIRRTADLVPPAWRAVYWLGVGEGMFASINRVRCDTRFIDACVARHSGSEQALLAPGLAAGRAAVFITAGDGASGNAR